MPPPTITPLPTPAPSRNMQRDEFNAAANAMVAALGPMVTETNVALGYVADTAAQVAADRAQTAADAALAASSAMSAGVIGTSTTTHTIAEISGGETSWTIETGKLFTPGMWVTMAVTASPAVGATARVKSYNAGTGALVLLPSSMPSGSGSYSAWSLSLAAVPAGIGKFALWIPAGAMSARVTGGAAYGVAETATNKVILRSLDFDASAIEYAQFSIRMPKSWDEGTVTFVPTWSHGSATTNFKVSWGLQAVALSDGDAMDAAFGTAQFSNDTGGVATRSYAGPESAAITVGGSPQAEDLVVFQVFRKADDATNDTLAVDARLHGITVFIQTDAGSDA